MKEEVTKGQSRRRARNIWMKHFKASILPGIHLHHIDGNCFNNSITNLLLCTPKEHWLIHKKQGDTVALNGRFIQSAGWFLGGSHTEETKKKISETRKGIAPWNRGKPNPSHAERMSGTKNPMFGRNSWGKCSTKQRVERSEKVAKALGGRIFLAWKCRTIKPSSYLGPGIFEKDIFVGEFINKSAFGREYGIGRKGIERCLNKQTPQSGGFVFEYKK